MSSENTQMKTWQEFWQNLCLDRVLLSECGRRIKFVDGKLWAKYPDERIFSPWENWAKWIEESNPYEWQIDKEPEIYELDNCFFEERGAEILITRERGYFDWTKLKGLNTTLTIEVRK